MKLYCLAITPVGRQVLGDAQPQPAIIHVGLRPAIIPVAFEIPTFALILI